MIYTHSMQRAVQYYADRPALRVGDRLLTFQELHNRVKGLVAALCVAGFQPGDRLALLLQNGPECIQLVYACSWLGLVVVPINTRLSVVEIDHLLADASPRGLVRHSSLPKPNTPVPWEVVADEEPLEGTSAPCPDACYDPEGILALIYTSGTTGRPKGAMLSHRAVLSLGRQNALSFRLSGHVVWGLTGSMSFVAVVPAHVLCCIALGGTLVMMGHYDVPALLEAIERERVTFTYVPSPLLAAFAAAVRERPASIRSLHSVLHSASRAAPAQLRDVFDAVGDRLVEGWGMTEHSGGLATATTPDDYLDLDGPRDVFASAGRSAAGVAVRLVDGDGRFLAHDGETIGELVISSPSLMSGYWKQPKATEAVLRDGWYHTGDLGTIDADGYVVIAERRTDLIVSGGMNVYPSEVEQCIAAMPGVAEVAVVGLPHERWGQTVVAAVVAADTVTEADVVAHCREGLASFKKPSRVVFVDALPRTAGMKVARAVLREQLDRVPQGA
jgi:fatty-acyl-CoA synthase